MKPQRAGSVVVLAGVAAALHVGKLPPALPVLQQELGITLVQAGFLLALVQIGAMALGLVAGLLSDGLGLRRCMLAGLAVLGAASLAGAWADTAPSLLWLRGVEGLGVLLVTVPAPSLLRRSVAPARLTRMLGVWGAFMPLGTALALLLGPLVIHALGWRAWWLLTGALALAMLAWLQRAVPPDPRRAAAAPAHAPGAVPGAVPVAPGGTSPGPAQGWRQRLGTTLRAPGPWLGALVFALYSAQWLAVVGFLPMLYQRLGWHGAWVALLTASVAGANILGNIGAGRLLHRGLPPRNLLWAGFAAMALGAWLAFGHSSAGLPLLGYAGALLFSAAGGLVPGTLFGLAPRLAPDERSIATTVGWMQQCSAIGQMSGPPLVAWLAGALGSWQWTWVFTASCCLLGALLAARLGRVLRQTPARQGTISP
jgi:MFS family permease